MCTIHANSAREVLVKMCTLPLLAGAIITAALTSGQSWTQAGYLWAASRSS
jgi:hypothetical protein